MLSIIRVLIIYGGGLSATVGLRFDYEHAKIDYNQDKVTLTTGANAHVKDFISIANFRQFTPKFTLQYLTNRDNLYYASVTRGYKPGGFNTIFKTDAERAYDPRIQLELRGRGATKSS